MCPCSLAPNHTEVRFLRFTGNRGLVLGLVDISTAFADIPFGITLAFTSLHFDKSCVFVLISQTALESCVFVVFFEQGLSAGTTREQSLFGGLLAEFNVVASGFLQEVSFDFLLTHVNATLLVLRLDDLSQTLELEAAVPAALGSRDMAEGLDLLERGVLLVKEFSHCVGNTTRCFTRHDHLVVVSSTALLQGNHEGAARHSDDAHLAAAFDVELLVTIALVDD